jgi:type VI secretion system protein ImpA
MAHSDLDHLLQPITNEIPAGMDPRLDADPSAPFHVAKWAYQAALRAEKQADQNIQNYTLDEYRAWLVDSREEWKNVIEHTTRVLSSVAKDLETAAMLTEALFRREGFGGLAAGLKLIRQLIETYPDSIHPRIVSGDGKSEMDLRKVAWLSGSDLAGRFTRYPITCGSSTGPFAYWQYVQAQKVETLQGPERENLLQRGAITLLQFRQALQETTDEELRETYEGLQEATRQYEELNQLLKAQSQNPPSFRNVQQVLDQCASVLTKLAGARLAPSPADSTSGSQESHEPESRSQANGIPPQTLGNGEIRDREEAFERLEDIAQYFETTEPQSLIPAAIRKVIRRGRLPVEQLLWEALGSEEAREKLFKEYDLPKPESN